MPSFSFCPWKARLMKLEFFLVGAYCRRTSTTPLLCTSDIDLSFAIWRPGTPSVHKRLDIKLPRHAPVLMAVGLFFSSSLLPWQMREEKSSYLETEKPPCDYTVITNSEVERLGDFWKRYIKNQAMVPYPQQPNKLMLVVLLLCIVRERVTHTFSFSSSLPWWASHLLSRITSLFFLHLWTPLLVTLLPSTWWQPRCSLCTYAHD